MATLFEKLAQERTPAKTSEPSPAQKLTPDQTLLGDPIANKILRELRQRRPEGLNRRAIFGLVHRNHKKAKLDAELNKLWLEGKIRCERKVPTGRRGPGGWGGRPAEVWYASAYE